jgi:ketosteroid isomerase-like protein
MIATQEQTETAEEAIAENNRRFAAAAARGDAGAMVSVYAIDADFLPPERGGTERPGADRALLGRRHREGDPRIELETLRPATNMGHQWSQAVATGGNGRKWANSEKAQIDGSATVGNRSQRFRSAWQRGLDRALPFAS